MSLALSQLRLTGLFFSPAENIINAVVFFCLPAINWSCINLSIGSVYRTSSKANTLRIRFNFNYITRESVSLKIACTCLQKEKNLRVEGRGESV